ncbi:hypothetical protein [Nonomuraea dietziae]|uniref:hypothetical protein n=1 Tax=Nonomuraea dietziae TaxID=65515 RepID=UPI0031CF4251
MLRSRRGRDLLAVGVIVFVLMAQLPNLIVNRGLAGDPLAMVHSIASVLRWTPSGWAAHAISDGGLVGLAELVALAALVLALGWLWIRALSRALVTTDASTQAASVRRSSGPARQNPPRRQGRGRRGEGAEVRPPRPQGQGRLVRLHRG